MQTKVGMIEINEVQRSSQVPSPLHPKRFREAGQHYNQTHKV